MFIRVLLVMEHEFNELSELARIENNTRPMSVFFWLILDKILEILLTYFEKYAIIKHSLKTPMMFRQCLSRG